MEEIRECLFKIYFSGETLNFISLVMQFYLVDVFLNNKFRWFGMEEVEYYSWSFRDRQNRDLMLRWVHDDFND